MLDQLFMCVVCPLFFVETMTNIAKEFKNGRSAEDVVASLAERTPVTHSYMNTFHINIFLEELHGEAVDNSSRRPVVAGGIPVKVDGKAGIVYKQSPEAAAFERWQDGRFRDVERITATFWRDALQALDLSEISGRFKSFLRKTDRPKSHADAHQRARAIVDATGQSYKVLLIAHHLLGLPPDTLQHVVHTWKQAGSLPFRDHAPFAAHCLEVELYFCLALSNGIIPDQRASNRIDIGYLYYIPFANVFVSSDKLHRTSAPLFLGQDQKFVWGPDLKKDLAILNDYFLSLTEKEKAQGLFTLVKSPPVASTGVSAMLWDEYRAGWRKPKPPAPKLKPEQHAEIIGASKSLIAAADRNWQQSDFDFAHKEDVSHMIIQRHIPRQRGSWRMFSEAVEEAEDEANAERQDIAGKNS